MNNKLLNILILLLLALFMSFRLFTACNQMEADMEPQSEQSDPIDSLPSGYTGLIPCADCPGIEVYLLLEENNRFTELNWYRDRNPEPFVTDGTWHLRADTLTIYNSDLERLKTYLYGGDMITMLDGSMQRITGELSDVYVLERSQEQTSIRRQHRQLGQEQNIHFLASGNEPFWSIRVDFEDTLHYITPESEWGFPASRQNTDEEISIWTVLHENTTLTVTAEKSWCRDTMSGFLFTHEVQVEFDSDKETEHRGCGRFLNSE